LKVFPILGLAHGPMCEAALAPPLMSSATNSGLAVFVPSYRPDDVIMVMVMVLVMVMVIDDVIKAGMGLCQT